MLPTRRLFEIVLFLALFTLATRNITDGDFWWHLRTGEYILQTRTIPHQDIFSYTRAGQEWVTHEWLSQVFIATVFNIGGFGALILTFPAIIASAFFLAYRRSVGNLYVSAFVTLLGALATAVVWDVRPQMIGLLMTSIFLWILDRYRRNEMTPAIWLLVPLMLLWVNLHGSFVLGLVLAALYLVAGFVERLGVASPESKLSARALYHLALIIVLMLLVIPLNPNGARMYAYPLETLNDPIMQSQISEWQSPDFHRIEFQPFTWLLLATFVASGFARRRPSFTQILLLAVTLFEALRAVRLIPLFVLVAIPILSEAVPIGATTSALRQNTARLFNWAVLGVLLLATVLYAGIVIQNQPESERATYPKGAVDFIQRENLNAPMFNLYEWGGYLIWRLYPGQRVFIDGRADVYGPLIQDYLATYRAAPNWHTALDSYDVGLVLIPPSAPLAALLTADSRWRRIFQDNGAVIFIRN
jgi:hypothetical protein